MGYKKSSFKSLLQCYMESEMMSIIIIIIVIIIIHNLEMYFENVLSRSN